VRAGMSAATRAVLRRLHTGRDMRAMLAAVPRPASPIAQPWELSIATLIGSHPRVPSIAAKLLRRLDRFGRVSIRPDRVGFDDKTIRWSRVIEVRTYTTTGLVPHVVIDREVERIREMFPPVPGRRWLVRKAAEGLLTVVMAGAGQRLRHAAIVPMLPCEIVYRNVFGRRVELPAGLFAAAMMAAIPEAGHSLTTTARALAIPVQTMTDAAGAARAVRAERLRQKAAPVAVRLHAYRSQPGP
jgi:hypothetical protein